jgi:uncharacterized membrane protein YjfL (UPF0719 family)
MDWTFLFEVSAHLLRGLPLFGGTLLVLVAARFLFLLSTPFRVGNDLVDAENPAIGLVFGAWLFGVALALAGTLFGRGEDETLAAVGKILVEGAMVVALLRISIWVNDRLILHRFCIVKEIRDDRNLGVGFCVAGSCVASGLILNGALTGFSENFASGLRDIAIFWLLGQITLVSGAFVYHKISRYDVHALIEHDDNVAVGIGFGAFLVSLGLVVRAAIVGAGLDSISRELPRTLLLALVGVLCVIVVNAVAPLLVTAKVKYEDEVEMHGNIAVSTVTACATLAAAMLLASIIQR